MAEKKIHPAHNQLLPFPSTVDRDGSFGSSSDHILPVSNAAASPPSPSGKKPEPTLALAPPPSYVFEIPKERIFRYPPPENAKKFNDLSKQKPRRGGCRACLCATIGVLLFLIIGAAIAAGVLYLVFRPKAPDYAVTDLSIRGMNLTASLVKSPEFDVSIRADNSNKKIGIYYQSGSEVQVLYDGVPLAKGALPAFFQPSKNVTVFQTALTGSDTMLGNSVRLAMQNDQKKGRVPLLFIIKAPVKIKVGSVKTWKITVKVKCDVAVEALDEKANIVSNRCDYSARLW